MNTAVLVSAFDIVDAVDVALVRQAASECGGRVVARVLGDEVVSSLTDRPAVVPETERLEIVRALRLVSEASLYDPADPAIPRDHVVYGRGDQYRAELPVTRWLPPRGTGVGATPGTLPRDSEQSAGGDVVRTSGRSPNHATLTGLTPSRSAVY